MRSSSKSPIKSPAKSSLKPMSTKGSRKTFLDPDQMHYIPSSELPKLKMPIKYIQPVIDGLSHEDWETQFTSCNDLRSLTVHHAALLSKDPTKLTIISTKLLRQIENKRSNVSKNAIMAAGDLFKNLKGALDPEIEGFLPILIKKSADTNQFL